MHMAALALPDQQQQLAEGALAVPEALPWPEVLRHVQWSARATSKAFQRVLEALRTKVKLKLTTRSARFFCNVPRTLAAMLSHLPRLTAIECNNYCLRSPVVLPLPRLTSPVYKDAQGLTDSA